METALGAALPRSRFVRVHFSERDDSPVSRVEEIADPLLVLRAAKDQFGRVIMPAVGERLVLSWGTRSGTATLPAKVVDTSVQPSPRWRVQVEDKPVNLERRAFVRLNAQLPLALRAKDRLITATLRDISEGGLRCRFAGAAGVEAGDEVEVAVELHGWTLTTAAAVLRVLAVNDGHRDDRHELALLLLDLSEAQAARIRRYIFAEQARPHAASRG
jgi:hypothetical protein